MTKNITRMRSTARCSSSKNLQWPLCVTMGVEGVSSILFDEARSYRHVGLAFSRKIRMENASPIAAEGGDITHHLVRYHLQRVSQSGAAQDRTVLPVASSDRCRLIQHETLPTLGYKLF